MNQGKGVLLEQKVGRMNGRTDHLMHGRLRVGRLFDVDGGSQ